MTLEAELVNRIARLESKVAALEAMIAAQAYKGEQAGSFTTAELPYPGDYGTQTDLNELQININGSVRAITTHPPTP